MQNAHVIAFLRKLYFEMEAQGRLWAMAFVGDWYEQELSAAEKFTEAAA